MNHENSTTVLLVEDDYPVRLYLSGVLGNHGFKVFQAEDGKKACEILAENKGSIAAIISDLRMPKMSGGELAEFNYENMYLPFIACTAIEDAKTALKLLKFGVRDYIVKPVEEANFVSVVKNAIGRRFMGAHLEDDVNPYAGNLGSVTIPSKMQDIQRAYKWLEGKLEKVMSINEMARFKGFMGEFLMNAHEHGNLKIGKDEKVRLIDEGKYEEELRAREEKSMAKIQLDLSILKDQIAVNITDDGYGFNYDEYLEMTEEDLVERLGMPSGRGIFMAAKWFDNISFSKGGRRYFL